MNIKDRTWSVNAVRKDFYSIRSIPKDVVIFQSGGLQYNETGMFLLCEIYPFLDEDYNDEHGELGISGTAFVDWGSGINVSGARANLDFGANVAVWASGAVGVEVLRAGV